MSVTGAHFSECKKELQSCSLDALILKSTRLQSPEICSAMKQRWTWLASLLPPNSNKGALFSPSRQQTLAHIFRETPVRAGRARGVHRGGHSDPVNLREAPRPFLIPALPQLNANGFTDSTDALCSPGKGYKRMFRHIPQIKPYLPEQHFPLISLRKKNKMLQKPTWASVKDNLYLFYFKESSLHANYANYSC